MDEKSLPERTLAAFRQVVGPATIVTSALFYFGWVRSRAVADYYGIEVELLNYSAADLTLRSVTTVFPVLVFVAVVALVAVAVFDRWISHAAATDNEEFFSLAKVHASGKRWRKLAWPLIVLGIASLASFEILLAINSFLPLLGPGLALSGIALLAASQRMETAKRVTAKGIEGYSSIDSRFTLPLGIAGLAAIFVAVFVVADWRGDQIAANRARNIERSFPAVVLTSQHELHLLGLDPGRVLTDQGTLSTPWSRQYDGLRLWIEANDRWFLIPDDWNENKVVHIVQIDETVRLDIDDRS